MIDPLFEKLLLQIDQFIELSKAAPAHLTKEAVLENKPNKAQLKGWHDLVADTIDSRDKLKRNLSSRAVDNDRIIDRDLIAFRQLARYFAEVSCDWSSYYLEIKKHLGSLAKARFEVEKKYHLGKFKNS